MWKCKECGGTNFTKEETEKVLYRAEFDWEGEEVAESVLVLDEEVMSTIECEDCFNKSIFGLIEDIAEWEEENDDNKRVVASKLFGFTNN